MRSIQLMTHINDDGLLQITLPNDLKNRDVEVMVIVQPLESQTFLKSQFSTDQLFAHLRPQVQYFADITAPTTEEWSDEDL